MKLSARNQFAGKVVEITEGATNGIVKIEIAPEVVISASITNESIKELGLKVGETAYAVIKASNVMVGADHSFRSIRLIPGGCLLWRARVNRAEPRTVCTVRGSVAMFLSLRR